MAQKRSDDGKYEKAVFSAEEVALSLRRFLKGEEIFLGNLEGFIISAADEHLALMIVEEEAKEVINSMVDKGILHLPDQRGDYPNKVIIFQ